MNFTLDNYKNDPSNSNLADSGTPSALAKLLKTQIIQRYETILSEIHQGTILSIRERQIVARQIALLCKVSPSTLTLRRQPDLVALISRLNEDLELAFISNSKKKVRSGSKKTQQELLSENKAMTLEVSRLSNLRIAEALSAAIENILTEESRLQAYTIRKLKDEIIHLQKVIDNQAELQQKNIHSITEPSKLK